MSTLGKNQVKWVSPPIPEHDCGHCKHFVSSEAAKCGFVNVGDPNDPSGRSSTQQWVPEAQVKEFAVRSGAVGQLEQVVFELVGPCSLTPQWSIQPARHWCGNWAPKIPNA